MRSAVNARFEESVESKQGRPRGGMLVSGHLTFLKIT